jgi:hypothetical protein
VRRRARGPEIRRRILERDAAAVGWRFWSVRLERGGYRLHSPFRNNLWPPGEPLVAECVGTDVALGARGRRKHDVPSARCRCGIYGGTYRGLRTFLDGTFVPLAEPVVIGRVALWGAVIEEPAAHRAARAYPERLLVPTLLRDAARIATDLRAYDVPVIVLDIAETFAALNPVVAARAPE